MELKIGMTHMKFYVDMVSKFTIITPSSTRTPMVREPTSS